MDEDDLDKLREKRKAQLIAAQKIKQVRYGMVGMVRYRVIPTRREKKNSLYCTKRLFPFPEWDAHVLLHFFCQRPTIGTLCRKPLPSISWP